MRPQQGQVGMLGPGVLAVELGRGGAQRLKGRGAQKVLHAELKACQFAENFFESKMEYKKVKAK